MLQSDLDLPVCKGVREKRGFCSKGGWREEECEKAGVERKSVERRKRHLLFPLRTSLRKWHVQ